MLTKKQIKELPKGTYSNLQLHEKFPDNFGKARRIGQIPVDKLGNFCNVLSQDFHELKRVLLGRKEAKKYFKY
jgi:ligand-binding sensor protein